MGYVRELLTTEREEAEKMARLRDRHSGTDPISDEGLAIILDSIGDPSSPRKIFGYFEDEKLISFIAVRYLTLGGEKCWLIVGLFTNDFHNHFSFTRPHVGMLLAETFKYAERNGYYTYVYSIVNRLARVYEKQWAKQDWIPMTGRYELITMCVVPPNTDAPTDWQTRMMGGPKPDEVVFKKRVLKMEFRK